eukprot:69120-Pyramimonas_sp.AAC.1
MSTPVKKIRGELNSSVVNLLIKGLTDSFHLRPFSGICEKIGGELNCPVVDRLNKGLMAAWSPTERAADTEL